MGCIFGSVPFSVRQVSASCSASQVSQQFLSVPAAFAPLHTGHGARRDTLDQWVHCYATPLVCQVSETLWGSTLECLCAACRREHDKTVYLPGEETSWESRQRSILTCRCRLNCCRCESLQRLAWSASPCGLVSWADIDKNLFFQHHSESCTCRKNPGEAQVRYKI